jgi:diguanylate cyclase (GGDEF)-like protein/PAS domain S-box-containing protein
MLTVLGCIAFEHDIRLVLLAAAVCVMACWTTLSLLPRAEADRRVRDAWLLGTGFAFGSGVWATHFIAELAFRSSLPIGFAPTETAISLGVAIAGSVVGFGLVLSRPGSMIMAGTGGAVVGVAIGAMHFIGMAALRFPGVLSWNFHFVLAAILIGVAFSILAMVVLRLVSGLKGRIAAATLLALAILGLHFTAMAAVSLTPMAIPVPSFLLSGTLLAVIVAAVALPILLLGLAGAAFDQESARRSDVAAERLRRFADATFEGILFHRDGVITDVNAVLSRLRGERAEEMVGQRLDSLLPALADRGARGPFEPFETELRACDGATTPVEIQSRTIEGDGDLAVVVVRDISERQEQARKIQFLAHYDVLTGLPNRVLFNDRLSSALAMSQRSGNRAALLCLDLDGFKMVNDGLGHPAGDRLLVAVGRRLSAELREVDTAARLGGDEFAIVQPLADQPGSAAALARRLVDRLGEPFDLDGHQVRVGASIGVALFPDDASTAEILLRNADLALFRAKQEGRGTFCCFEPEMDQQLRHRRLLEQDLRHALDRGELEVHYQKLCDANSLAVLGYEALCRWRHPTRGWIAPSEFIPIAEESGLIIRLGRFVLEAACAEAAAWSKPLTISINVSPAQFVQQDLVAMVAEVLRAARLAPEKLELEITEGVLIGNTERALKVLRGFQNLGVRISLDDFGTGYSSLAYLRQFQFDAIKIDRSFVQGLCTDKESATIVRSIVALCRSLDLRVTAEGVETPEQLARLREYGCNVVQGYLLGRPAAVTSDLEAERATVSS